MSQVGKTTSIADDLYRLTKYFSESRTDLESYILRQILNCVANGDISYTMTTRVIEAHSDKNRVLARLEQQGFHIKRIGAIAITINWPPSISESNSIQQTFLQEPYKNPTEKDQFLEKVILLQKLYESEYIQGLRDIFSVISLSQICSKLSLNIERINTRLNNPFLFRFKEILKLSTSISLPFYFVLDLIIKEIETLKVLPTANLPMIEDYRLAQIKALFNHGKINCLQDILDVIPLYKILGGFYRYQDFGKANCIKIDLLKLDTVSGLSQRLNLPFNYLLKIIAEEMNPVPVAKNDDNHLEATIDNYEEILPLRPISKKKLKESRINWSPPCERCGGTFNINSISVMKGVCPSCNATLHIDTDSPINIKSEFTKREKQIMAAKFQSKVPLKDRNLRRITPEEGAALKQLAAIKNN